MKTLSPALIVSCAALAVALGGTGYAITALPKNSVGTKQLKNSAVTGAKIKAGSVEASDLAAGVFAKATGPAGATGATGATGPSGITGTAVVNTMAPVTVAAAWTTLMSLGPSAHVADRRSTGPITVNTASKLVINATVVLSNSGAATGSFGNAPGDVLCALSLDGTQLGLGTGTDAITVATQLPVGFTTIPLSTIVPVATGTHDVSVVCNNVGGTAVTFSTGSIAVTATTT